MTCFVRSESRFLGVIAAVACSSSAVAITSNLNGNAQAGNQAGVFQSFTDVPTATVNVSQNDGAFGNRAATVGLLSTPGGAVTLASHACSGGAFPAVGSASGAANGGADIAYIVTSGTLPAGTPVQVQVQWSVVGRVTVVGSNLMNVQDVAQASLNGQVLVSINDVTMINRSGGRSRSVNLFDGSQTIVSGNLDVLAATDSQTFTVLVGQRIRVATQIGIGAGSFAFNPAATDGDAQATVVWGLSSLNGMASVVLMENPNEAAPPASNGGIDHAQMILPARPDGVLPCATITVQPQSRSSCNGVAPFSVTATGSGTVSYAWQIELSAGMWVTLGNDPRPIMCAGGNGFAYAAPINSPTVTIGVNGCPGPFRVRAVVTDDCGATVSDAATLTICRADFNCDGTVNSQDFFDFLAAFFGGTGDFNHDGGTNSQDFFDFLNVFFGGC